jgi:putative ABC transport system permease protein
MCIVHCALRARRALSRAYNSRVRLDLIHLLRHLRRSPTSAAAAVATLALTLGAGASIFAVVDAVLLTPPPFANPDELVVVGETPVDNPAASPRAVGYATFTEWRERAGSTASLEAFDGTNFTLTGLGAAERISASYATPGFLTLLGVAPARGRGFSADDTGQRVAIVSHAFWQGTLGAERGVIGRTLVLGGRPHTIVGVLPRTFAFALSVSDVWLPFPVSPAQAAAAGFRVRVVARLSQAGTPADMARALDEVSRVSTPPARVVAIPIAAAIAGDAARVLTALAGAAALAVLIAFTNFAGLLLVRSTDRRSELAVRRALGAGPLDLVKHTLVEAEVLVALGIASGVLLALWITPVAARLAIEQFGAAANREVAVSWRVIAAVTIVASAFASVCALLPALMGARRTVVSVLRRGTTAPPRELRMRRIVVAGEVALAFVLLVSVAFLGRSLLRVLAVNPGFHAADVLVFNVSVPAEGYPTLERVVSFYSTLHAALAERLGPRATSIVDEVPLTGDRGRALVRVRPAGIGQEAVVREAGDTYFDVMRIPLVAGRSFDSGDNSSAPPRVVVSESLAERLFPSLNAIGRRVSLTGDDRPAEIIGLVRDVAHRALDETPVPTLYRSAWQSSSRNRIIVVRSERPDATAIVREEVARLDRDLPIYGRRSMAEVVDASPGVAARRLLTATFMAFAVLGVVLGAIGVFGVVAHNVASRRTELAVRIALGANPQRILSATLAQGVLLVGVGLCAGGVSSIWATRALSAALVAKERLDVASTALAAAVLLMATVGAILPAALKAARTDPLIALRAE